MNDFATATEVEAGPDQLDFVPVKSSSVPPGFILLPNLSVIVRKSDILGCSVSLSRNTEMSISSESVGPLTVKGKDSVTSTVTLHLASSALDVIEATGTEVERLVSDNEEDDLGVGQVSYTTTEITLNDWNNLPIEDSPAFIKLSGKSEKNMEILSKKLTQYSALITEYYAVSNVQPTSEFDGLDGLSAPSEHGLPDRAMQLREESQNRARENSAKQIISDMADISSFFDNKVVAPWVRSQSSDESMTVLEFTTSLQKTGDSNAADTILEVVAEDLNAVLA